ncbi:hypothetical protein THAOC_03731 [Thalassiosira oceanica]|uniref:Uncharacterized protein n=1 Tax=Thalassiosira oceanica TaxID=159749 RepID=K0TKH6_THAOC|nr:hypothetical protein THAOC_03731 [Thalassiosira oceanica]|eukprot:EJK74581.1 hypothetical protein THAOC_03731 [Thalassiosira oceanica]
MSSATKPSTSLALCPYSSAMQPSRPHLLPKRPSRLRQRPPLPAQAIHVPGHCPLSPSRPSPLPKVVTSTATKLSTAQAESVHVLCLSPRPLSPRHPLPKAPKPAAPSHLSTSSPAQATHVPPMPPASTATKLSTSGGDSNLQKCHKEKMNFLRVGVWGDDGVYPARPPSALCTPTGPLGRSVASFDLKQPSMHWRCQQ